MKTVADASVLIFLAKVRRLHWLTSLLKGPFYLPEPIKEEVFAKDLPPSEMEYLVEALKAWEIVSWRAKALRAAGGLSTADVSVLEIARKVDAEVILADEKALRAILTSRRHRVMGTLGILLLACRQKLADAAEITKLADELIKTHHFRISAETYQTFLKAVADIRTAV